MIEEHMNNTEDTILDDELTKPKMRRRKLLPLWIKIFTWIFLITGLIIPIGLIVGAMGHEFTVSLYGLQTTAVYTPLGFVLIALFALKGVTSFGLWTEKDWAIKLASIDAILGIAVCAGVMLILPFTGAEGKINLSIRLELVALIPYLIFMKNIKSKWLNETEL